VIASSSARGAVLGLTAAFLWSLTGVALRFVEAASSWQMIAWRAVIMGAVIAAYLVLRYRGGAVRAVLAIGRQGAIGGVVLGIGFTCYISAIQAATIANASILTALVPIAAALIARLVLGEVLAPRTGLYAAGALVGVGVMVAEGIVVGGWAGNAFALGATLCQSTFTVMMRGGRGVDMVPAIGVGCVVSFALSAALADGLAVTPRDLGIIAAVALISTLLGNVAFVLAARHVAAGVLALLTMAEVVLSPLWASVFVGEQPTRLALVGGAIVIAAVLAQTLEAARRPAA